ncbi:MAG: Dabb family protein [Lachnospiraceae bacterium]|nr:Dabb family protein [Lachnospiraceae bacterium]
MVKHVILWKLDESRTAEEKAEIKKNMKLHLEALIGKVPGLLEIKINIHPLASSNADVMLDATLEDEEALKNYAVHPEHVAAADTYVRPYTVQRVCMDYEI